MLRRHTRVLAAVAATAAIAAPTAQAGHGQDRFEKEPTAVGSGGAAATVDALATKAAIDTLRRGGNAVDATVAAAGVLGVTEPFSAGIGGGGFMVIRTPHGKVTTIDGREKAPAAMEPGSFIENRHAPRRSTTRATAGCRPACRAPSSSGTRRSTATARCRCASCSGPASTSPAAASTVDQTFFDQTQGNVDYFNDIPSTAAIYLDPDGTPRDVGTTLRNPDLARTYERIAERRRRAPSTAAGSRARSPRQCRIRRRRPPPTTSGAPA